MATRIFLDKDIFILQHPPSRVIRRTDNLLLYWRPSWKISLPGTESYSFTLPENRLIASRRLLREKRFPRDRWNQRMSAMASRATKANDPFGQQAQITNLRYRGPGSSIERNAVSEGSFDPNNERDGIPRYKPKLPICATGGLKAP